MSGLRRIHDAGPSEQEFERAMKTTGMIELGFLERGLVVLATVANVAPLLGFLGTVAGMISAFGAIAGLGRSRRRWSRVGSRSRSSRRRRG